MAADTPPKPLNSAELLNGAVISLYRHILLFLYKEKPVKQESKNISYKMLKDVGMTVLKSRETSEVYIYMQQHRG